MRLIDISAHIDNGDLGFATELPKTWNEFIVSDYGTALEEFLYIIPRHLNNNDMYASHLYGIYQDIYRYLLDEEQIENGIRKLKTENNFCNVFFHLGKEEKLVEACFQFAIFYLCREYAKISEFFGGTEELTPNIIKLLFAKNQVDPININDSSIFNRILSIKAIKKIHENESSVEKLAKIFSPVGTMNGLIDELSQINIDETIIEFNKCNSDVLNDIARCMYCCCVNEEKKALYKECYIKATGNGRDSIGLYGINNLGLKLFNYNTVQGKVQERNNMSLKLNDTNDVIHLFSFGYNHKTVSKIDICAGGYCFNFIGNRFCYNGLRPQRSSGKTIPDKYEEYLDKMMEQKKEQTYLEQDGICTDFLKTNRDGEKVRIASYNRLTNNLNIKNNHDYQSVSIKLVSDVQSYQKQDGSIEYDKEEFFLIVTVVTKKSAKDDITLNLYDYFEDDKFEITKLKANELFADIDTKYKLEQIINFLRENSDCEICPPILKGLYVGKYEFDIGTVVDKTIKPISINGVSKERENKYPSDKDLRYSEVIILLEKEKKKLSITICSTTSPVWSRLDERLCVTNIDENKNSFNNNVLKRLNDNYTNTHKILVKNGKLIPIYNQPLAMLRSMGVLEAIAKKLYSMEETSFMKEKMKNMLNSAFAVDKSAESREDSDTSYQLENTISYATYKSFKWYKDDADYNQYDHSINFDTTENHNN